jgi:hypothetical protein
MPGDVAGPFFHATAMFLPVGTLNLDFKSGNMGTARNAEPRIPRDLNRIHGIGNHNSAETEIVLCQRIGNRVTSVTDIVVRPFSKVRIADCLFNGIDAQVGRAEAACEFPRNRRLAYAGQTTEYDEHSTPQLRAPSISCQRDLWLGR